jgi:hypothetical protein
MSGPATARSFALEAIRRVIDLRAYSNLVLPGLLARSRLDARDRAFATELTYGTLRRLLPVDAATTRVEIEQSGGNGWGRGRRSCAIATGPGGSRWCRTSVRREGA